MLDLVSPEKQKEAQPAGVEERPAEGEKPLEEKQPAEGEEQALVKDQPATKEEGDGSGNKGDSGKPAAEKKECRQRSSALSTRMAIRFQSS